MDKAILPEIGKISAEAVHIRRRIHANPELGFEETATGDLVAGLLAQWGYEVTRMAGTGVVGRLRNGAGRALGLRADMDALPIHEATNLAWRSTIPGRMHACGHDGHTAMLLAAARHLAESRNFAGTLNLLFQPAEEGLGGAARMLAEGLFDRFPCEAVFAMHNLPGLPTGQLAFRAGPAMASADSARIRVEGMGGHGATPHATIDPVVVGAAIVSALQSIVARNVDPQAAAVVTVGRLHAGDTANVIPETAEMELTIRCLSPDLRDMLESRIRRLAEAQAESFGARAVVDYRRSHPVLVNHPAETAMARRVAEGWLGREAIVPDLRPAMASEDFALMLEHCPGSYIHIGNGVNSAPLHNPHYDFNDEALAMGASYWVKLAEAFLAPGAAAETAGAQGDHCQA
ncbi:M20 aminoacylase family protein [Paracoccus pantotrophus]|uniref:M20 aminoacylase family protein n=1 Tax=Paracoccus pantotrophus TaxID=82367 RepID=UPI0004AF1575|nr:M20 aminoacylase family protein [Paracoccus pantotrophus]MDF3856128.1 M20 family metallopeptidase [Paracoccus pantotrophus]RNI16570.1 amidohydrolase [Paracoccus pantotrophus]SFO98043.1 hippurate hydrolase [Paracoccus pantotrophus]